MFKDTIVSISHNDLDAMGCELSIEYKYGNNVEYYNTNYINLYDIIDDVILNFQRYNYKTIIISDISFSNYKDLLIELIDTCVIYDTEVIFVDHHLYPKDFFESFDKYDNFNYTHDTTKCASISLYKHLHLNNKDLLTFLELVNVYDLWLCDDEKFLESTSLNNLFWKNKKFLYSNILKNKYSLPNNFEEHHIKYIEKSKMHVDGLISKNLCLFNDYMNVWLSDEHFDELLLYSFNNDETCSNICVIINTKGIVRVRFKDNTFNTNIKDKIKYDIINEKYNGHLNAFTYKLKNNDYDSILLEIKNLNDIILRYKEFL